MIVLENSYSGYNDDPLNTFLESVSLMVEASTTLTYYFKDALYPKIEAVLKTPDGKKKFLRIVEEYVNKNNTKLTAIGPMYLIPFTYEDKDKIFKLFNLTEKETIKIITEVINKINEKASWVFIKQNPIYTVLYYVIRYFTINRDDKLLNSALLITALAYYPSIWSKYYKFPPDPGIMQYTIDNLSNRFIIKKSSHMFSTLVYSIQNSWRFHEKLIIDGSDANCVKFIQRIRNDQNSLMKKIKNAYMENYKKGLRVQTSVDSYDDSVVVDNENDTNRVESLTNKVVLQMLVNGLDLRISDSAASVSNVSKIELRNYISKILIENNSEDMKSFIESILFIYLYDEKHTFDEINSREFISFSLVLFKKTNSKNSNVINIKKMLDKWGEDSGIYGKFERLGTRIDYTKAIFLYFILSIQKYK